MEENKKKENQKIKIKPVQLRPFVYRLPSITEVSVKMLILLGLQLICLALTKSFRSLLVIFFSLSGAELAAIVHYFIKKSQGFSTITVALQGIMIGMLLPENYPVVTVFLLSFFVVIVAKFIYLNCINSWINVVSITVVIAFFIGRQYFPGFQITTDLFTLKNPSVYLLQKGVFPIYDFDVAVTNFFNVNLFSRININLPEGLFSILWDTHAVIPAFRFNLLTIIASIVLFSDNSLSSLIPGIFVLTYAALVRLFFPLMSGGVFNSGDIFLAVCTSGTLFVAIFLIQWFGTSPMTLIGKIFYGVIAGFLAFLIVGCGTSPIGMMYTILICNVINLIIRNIEEYINEKSISKIVMVKQG